MICAIMSTTTKKESNRPKFKLRKKLATWDSTAQWGCSHQSWWAELILRQKWRRRSTLRLLRWKHCWKVTSHLKHTAEFFVPLRNHLAAALVLSRKLSANMCKGLLYLQRVDDWYRDDQSQSQRHTFESLAREARLHMAEVLGLLPKHWGQTGGLYTKPLKNGHKDAWGLRTSFHNIDKIPNGEPGLSS